MHCSTPARRGSRSRPPLRRPRPLRFERLRVPVWDPYSRGRLGPAKSEDQKGGEGKVDADLTNFLSTDAAGSFPSTDETPSHSSRKHLLPDTKKSPPNTKEASESETSPPARSTAHSRPA